MGIQFLNFYRDKVKKTWKTAFYSAFFIGLLVHLYRFTHMLPNLDTLHNFFSSQNMVTSGRWFLAVACGISSRFDLPWVIGLVSLVFIGLTAAVLTEIFEMKNPCLIVLSSGLLASFPAIAATMAYEFTADGYMVAMLLAALSAVVTRIGFIGRGYWKRMAAGCALLCLSCGIYQAYVSFAFILAVCYFMMELLENRYETKRYLQWIGAQVGIYVTAMAGYYGIWKLMLHLYGIGSSTYQGMDQMALPTGMKLVQTVAKMVKEFVLFFVEKNPRVYGFSVYSVLNITFLLVFFAGLVLAMVKSGAIRRMLHVLLIGLCLVFIPLGCYIWYLTSDTLYYHALMLQSICVLYIFTAVLFERWAELRLSNLAWVFLWVIVLNNSMDANKYYSFMELCYERTTATAVEITGRVHQVDDGTVKYVAFCGRLDDWPEEDDVEYDLRQHMGIWKAVQRTILSPLFFELYTDFDLAYYRINDADHPIVERKSDDPSPYNWYYRFPLLPYDQQEVLFQTEEVEQMPIWPAQGCIRVIGETVVVKLSD